MWADPRGGYAILALLVLGALGATLAPGGIRNRQRAPQRIFAAALLLGAAMSLTLRSRLIGRASAVARIATPAGVWVYGVDTLSIGADTP